MTTAQAKTHTLRLKRVLKAPRERVYDAFLNPDALAKWLPPAGFTGKVYHLEAKVGGRWRMSFSSLDGKWTQAFGGEFLELRPHDLIRYVDRFETDDPDMKGDILVTATFTDVPGGTEVTIVQEGIPAIIPLEDATKGWNSSLNNLANLVEL